ncbi:DNA primase/polymerase [Gordonia phage Alyssamiracle]|nr:DNA primase/polymerase [Gordonia phage Alyssamiracle]
MAEPARDINSSRPFHNTWEEYVEKGWVPIPLKPRLKNPNDVGTTGRKNPLPKGEDLTAWIKKFADNAPQKANIGLRMDQTIIGIDIDHYGEKTGYNQYEKMVEKFGPLPDTYISTARTDGKSGIRFFRIPSKYVGKLSWSGKASSHIDIIQYVHRFAAVYPSYHPETEGQYAWYDSEWNPIEIPSVADLPELPKEWVKFLTRGFMAWQAKPMDIDSSLAKVQEWYESHTAQGEMCRTMKKYLKTAIDGLDDAAAHDPLVKGHYSILMAAVDDQGHRGSLIAAKEFENAWLNRVKSEDGKRSGLREAKSEIYRSRAGALRLAKGRILGDSRDEDSELLNSIDWTASACRCIDMSEFEGTEDPDIPSTIAVSADRQEQSASDDDRKGPADFEMNDVGNAKYLTYLYSGNLKWVYDMGRFLQWSGKQWTIDTDRHLNTQLAFGLVHKHQVRYAEHLKGLYLEAMGLVDEARGVMQETGVKDGSVGAADTAAKAAKSAWSEWNSWSRQTGNQRIIMNALDAYGAVKGNAISLDILDSKPHLMGVANGVIELGTDSVRLRPMEREDYVTMQSPHPYAEGGLDELKRNGGDDWMGVKLWERYLDTFIPDAEIRHFVQKVMGYALWGANPHRLLIFLKGTTSTGKSVMLKMLEVALGKEYLQNFPLSIFNEEKDEKNPLLINLRNARIITASEPGAAQKMDESVIKRIVGDDPNTARYLNSNDTKTIKINALPIIATNRAPNIPNADAGLARRLCVIPFDHQVADKDDHKKEEMAKVCGPAILAWMVEGYINYRTEGLSRDTWPESVTSATESFSDELSDFGAFFKECLLRVEYDSTDEDTRRDTSLSLEQIHRVYKDWAEKTHEETSMGMRTLAKKIAGAGFDLQQGKYFDNKNTKRYRGLALAPKNGSTVSFKSGTK